MYNGLKYAFAFAGGAAVGGIVAWRLLKTVYERLAQEEIKNVKEVYTKKFGEPEENTEEEPATDEDEDDYEYLVFEGITQEYKTEEGGSDSMKNDGPKVIDPTVFGEDGYEGVSLIYWADGVLTDDLNQVVDNVEETVGFESLTHFGEYEDDAVHVRNERLKCDYEILMETREYYATVTTNLNPSGKE